MALNSSFCPQGFLSLLQANHFSLRVGTVLEVFLYIKKEHRALTELPIDIFVMEK